MRGHFKSTLLSATMMAGLLVLPLAARAAETATVPGNVSTWVASATKLGAAPDHQMVDVAVHMTLKDLDGLRALVASVSTPGSATYGHYLKPAAFRMRFAPDAADVQAVISFLQAAGMGNVHAGPAGAYVAAQASVAQLRATFGVSQDEYRFGATTMRANHEAPSIPASLAGKITYVEGLDDSPLMKHPHHVSVSQGEPVAARQTAAAAGATPAVTPPPVASSLPSPYCSTYFGDMSATLSTRAGPYGAKLPWLVCGYTPQQIQQAYGLSKLTLDGTGVTVAIVDAYASPTLQADSNQYATNHNLPQLTSANFTQIIPEGIYNVSPTETCGPQGWWVEESLDMAAVHGSAPGANILYVGARDCGTALDEALLNVIYNHQADVVSNSYGYNGEGASGASVAMADQAFMTAAAQGQTILFSSGDDGDLSQINGVATGSLEADSPYVTAVGGTSLALFNNKGSKGEWGWGTARDFLANATVNSATSITDSGLVTTSAFGATFYDFTFYAGSGGGISLVEAQPAYQAGVVPTSLATTLNEANGQAVTLNTKQRVSPDISMDADPYTGYLIGQSFTISGNGYSDQGCTATSDTTEYCEYAEGGTSLASPLMAGMVAVMNQARIATGKPLVGFANPMLYASKIGTATDSAAIVDVQAPRNPVAMLRGYPTALARAPRVITVNSLPYDIYSTPFPVQPCAANICEGVNDVFNLTTPGYDDVTGLGVPYAPLLVRQ